MARRASIEAGFALVKWLAEQLNDLQFEATLRNRVAGACLSIAQDHHAAVIVLLDQGLYASGFALIRLQYESYIRGLWLAHCATEFQVEQFSSGGEPPRINDLLAALQAHDAYAEGKLSQIKAESWSAMCSYTHTGSLQGHRWLTADAIEQNYPEEELIEVAQFTGAMALLAGIGMADIAQSQVLAHRLLERAREHAKNEF